MADRLQLDSATTAGPEIAVHFATGDSLYYPITKLAWGDDTATNTLVDTGTPIPVRLFGNTDSTAPVFVFNNAANPVYLAGDTAGTPVDDTNPLPVSIVSGADANDTTVTASISGTVTVDLGANNDVVNTAATPFFLAGDTGGTPVDDTNPFPVSIISGVDTGGNVVDTNNSDTSALAGGATFTGTGVDVSGYAAVSIMLKANEPSADSGMTFQFSTDNTNWDDIYRFTYGTGDTAGARRFQFPVTGQYFRVVYTNGDTANTVFRLQTILHHDPITSSIHRMGDTALSDDRSVQVVKSTIVAQRGGTGNFIPVAASANGNLKVDIEEGQNDSSTPIFVSNSAGHTLYIAGDTAGTPVDDTNPLPIAIQSGSLDTGSVIRIHGTNDTAESLFVKTDSSAPPIVRVTSDSSTALDVSNDSNQPLFVRGVGDSTIPVTNAPANPLHIASDTAATPVAKASPFPVQVIPTADSDVGLSIFRDATNDTTVALVSGAPVKLYGYYLFNPDTAAKVYVHFYNDTAVTLGTDSDVMVLGLPPLGGANVELTNGITFGTGLSVATTASATSTAVDAPGTAAIVNLLYK